MDKTVNSRHRLLAAILSIEGQLHTAAAYTDLLPTVLPDTPPFLLHRAGTLQAWDSLSLCSYYADLLKSKKRNCNIIYERYLYIQSHLYPERQPPPALYLRQRAAEKQSLIHYILREELRWEAQLYRQYPRLRKKGAPLYQIHTPRPDISFELSIQGELYTYSRLTLQTLLAYITQLRTRQRNFNKMVWQNICRISGYAYLQEEA